MRSAGVEFDAVLYLEETLDRDLLVDLAEQLGTALLRPDQLFRDAGLEASDFVEPEALADLLLERPILMQRPVIVNDGNAVIGRPPERWREVVSDGSTQGTETLVDPPPLDPLATGAGLAWFQDVVDDGSEAEADEAADRALVGQEIGHYQLTEHIGSGGMGVVYRAIDRRLSRSVALKFLPRSMVNKRNALERFAREARAVAALNHPNICVLHEIGEHEGRPFLALELLEGKPLDTLLREGPLEPSRALEIAAAVAEGLDSAHEAGILHRDIKPANLFVTERGHVKILDFGIAKLSPELDGATADADSPDLTRTGTAPGTCAYMSPEQIRGQELDWRTDLFSLGVVLYEMLSGERAFSGPTTGAIIEKILGEGPAPLPDTLRDTEIAHLVKKAMSRERSERFGSAAEMRQELERYRVDLLTASRSNPMQSSQESSDIDSAALESDPGRSPSTDSPQVGFGRTTKLLAAIATLVALITTAVWIGRSEPGETLPQEVAEEAATSPPSASRATFVAVLPIEDLSPELIDPYLALSVPDEVINVLTHSRELSVRPFADTRQYDPSTTDSAQIGEELGVDHLVTGQMHLAAGAFHLTLEATDVAARRIVWRDTLDLDEADLLSLRQSLAERVENGLLAALGVASMDTGTDPRSAEAYRLYLEALPELNDPEQNQAAIEKLERAVALDPYYAPLWAELGRRRHVSGFYWNANDGGLLVSARAAIETALELDPELIEATAALVEIDLSSGRVESAYRSVQELTERRPGSAYPKILLATVLRYAGHVERAVEACEEAATLDALDRRLRSCFWAYMWHGDYETAKRFSSFAASLLWANEVQARIALMQGQEGLARSLWSRQEQEAAGRLRRDYLIQCLAGKNDPGNQKRLREEFQDLLAMGDPEWQFYSSGYFAVCDDKSSALELLDRAVRNGYCVDPSVITDPLLQPLSEEPEYEELRAEASVCRERIDFDG